MSQADGKTSLDPSALWAGGAIAGSQRKPFRYVPQGTTLATGCIKTKEGTLSDYNASMKRHQDLAMLTRR